MKLIGDGQVFSVHQVDFSVFLSQLSYGLADFGFEGPRGFVPKSIEDFDARIADRVVAGGDHAPHSGLERQHGVVEGRRGARVDVDYMASCQSKPKGQRSDQSGVMGALVPSNHHRVAFTWQRRLSVRKSLTDQSHEGRCQGALVFQASDGRGLINIFQRC